MTHQEYLDWCKDISERMKKADFLYEYHFTNADRIRAMTDEELAEFILMVWGNGRAARHPSSGWAEWLKEEGRLLLWNCG